MSLEFTVEDINLLAQITQIWLLKKSFIADRANEGDSELKNLIHQNYESYLTQSTQKPLQGIKDLDDKQGVKWFFDRFVAHQESDDHSNGFDQHFMFELCKKTAFDALSAIKAALGQDQKNKEEKFGKDIKCKKGELSSLSKKLEELEQSEGKDENFKNLMASRLEDFIKKIFTDEFKNQMLGIKEVIDLKNELKAEALTTIDTQKKYFSPPSSPSSLGLFSIFGKFFVDKQTAEKPPEITNDEVTKLVDEFFVV